MRLPRFITSSPKSSDRRIAEALQQLFEDTLALADSAGLSFHVRDGRVQITGPELDAAEMEAITRQTRGIPGIVAVEHVVNPDRPEPRGTTAA